MFHYYYCLFHYKLSYKGSYFDHKNQFSVRWNDPKLKIKWPIKKPILSKRDKMIDTNFSSGLKISVDLNKENKFSSQRSSLPRKKSKHKNKFKRKNNK